jgi:hypothetical protein
MSAQVMLKGIAIIRFSLMKTARVKGRHMPAQVVHEGSAMLWLDQMKDLTKEKLSEFLSSNYESARNDPVFQRLHELLQAGNSH